MKIEVPYNSLIVLIGPAGSGKSTFARKYFRETEIVSADRCRALISDDENNQRVTDEAFGLLHTIVDKRLEFGRLTVVDATNVQLRARKPLLLLAGKHRATPIALVFKMPLDVCFKLNKHRKTRRVPEEAIVKQKEEMEVWLDGLSEEGFQHIYTLHKLEDSDRVSWKWRRE
jgi:protein phosphatase